MLMLLTDGYGGAGGIAKFNRDFLQALDGCSAVARVHAFPRLIAMAIPESIPERVVYDRAAARGRVAFIRRLVGYVCRGHRPQLVVCGHLHLLPAAWLLARVCRAKLALIVHGIEAWTPSRKLLVKRLARLIDCGLVVSRYSAARFASWSGVPLERLFVLPNCVDLQRFLPLTREPNLIARYGLQGSTVLLTVGRLASAERYKGFDQVIELMPRLVERFPSLKYLVVGGGDDRGRLEKKAKELGVSGNVVFAGQIPEAEKVAHYNLADAFVMPSTGEGFGIVLIEAAACGLPVIGSRADGSREALLDGRLGRLVDPKSPSELYAAIVDALQSPGERRRIDDVETFGSARFQERVEGWLTQLIGSPVTTQLSS
ncbi:glycosyltransferase family 4 protein [Rhodoplanes sp. Z2-YC6860]|uniref:glycosyltransferase family 4 protein n=1 Tax=Rhodoplanes sp. Z2-YC6860 TaxID=674703 RepID=UPI001F2DDE5C|nr:glycosyltransferase family 4 protein [Rhodoplanes sp. Z2-YC6860]